MGRHGQPPPPREVPWEVLAWGAFATSTAAGLVWWTGMGLPAAVFVAAIGLVSMGLIAVLSVAASVSVPKQPPHEPDPARDPHSPP